jgi:GWxTD domain-containing protein
MQTPAADRYTTWLNDEVAYIISDAEKDYFLKLTDPGQKDLFIDAFWAVRDPTPGTAENEYKTEHYRRLKRADGLGSPGRKTEMGKVYIILGEPVKQISFSGDLLTSTVFAWLYPPDWTTGVKYYYYFVFYKPSPDGDYIIYSAARHGPQALVAGTSDPQEALNILLWTDPLLGQLSLSPLTREHTPIMKDNAAELRHALGRISGVGDKLVRAVSESRNFDQKNRLWRIKEIMSGAADDNSGGDYSQVSPKAISRFVVLRNPAGRTALYYIFQVDSSDIEMTTSFGCSYALLKASIRAVGVNVANVVEKEQYFSTVYNSHEILQKAAGPMVCAGDIELPRGRFNVELTIANPINRTYFILSGSVDVPSSVGGNLDFSEPLLLYQTGNISTENMRDRPYVLSEDQYVANLTGTVIQGQDVCLYYQLFFPRRDRVSSVNVRYTLSSGDNQVWRHTESLDSGMLRPGGVFVRAYCVPTARLTPGDYTLRISASTLSPPEAHAQLDFNVVSKSGKFVAPRQAGLTR